MIFPIILSPYQKLLHTLRPFVPDTNLSVINVGLELDIYKKAANEQTSNIRFELNWKKILHWWSPVAEFIQIKLWCSCRSCCLSYTKKPDVHFLVIGSKNDVNYYNQLEERLLALNIRSNFHFLGFRLDVPKFLANVMFCINVCIWRGPYVLLEAMICHCAAVATKCGGIVEDVIKDKDSGLLIEIGDFRSLADNILCFSIIQNSAIIFVIELMK